MRYTLSVFNRQLRPLEPFSPGCQCDTGGNQGWKVLKAAFMALQLLLKCRLKPFSFMIHHIVQCQKVLSALGARRQTNRNN